MKQTAVDFLAAEQAELFLQFTNKKISLSEYAVNITNAHKQAKDFFREQMIGLVQSLKDYTNESGNILGHDEREASEFVDIYYANSPKESVTVDAQRKLTVELTLEDKQIITDTKLKGTFSYLELLGLLEHAKLVFIENREIENQDKTDTK